MHFTILVGVQLLQRTVEDVFLLQIRKVCLSSWWYFLLK